MNVLPKLGTMAVCFSALITMSLAADPLLYIDDTNGKVGTVDLVNDTVNFLGDEGPNLTLHDLAFTSDGNLWGTSETGFYSVNTTTGLSHLVGNYGAAGGGDMLSLVGNGTSLLAASGSNDKLYTILTSPFSVTAHAGVTGGDTAGDLVFGSNNILYDSELVSTRFGGDVSELVKLDVTPGGITHTDIGTFTDNTVIVGMATIGGVTYGVSDSGTEIFSINLTNAALTPVFNYGGHGLGTALGAAAKPATSPAPEPASVWLLAAGLGAFALYRRFAIRGNVS